MRRFTLRRRSPLEAGKGTQGCQELYVESPRLSKPLLCLSPDGWSASHVQKSTRKTSRGSYFLGAVIHFPHEPLVVTAQREMLRTRLAVIQAEPGSEGPSS